ncbi:hypothetical protein B6U83_02135 [Thermoplasmatales archaeon ex4484_36]|nr:MAG: hypothetical protein B6U83_02135 [Thermoplasmatales archaeon ex4484_36]RLF56271.1 MAG: hypothetical protein DRN28_00845 [Thermoplasmata archaeon]HDD60212.1 hypothetical protein [Euryarchaeota archaeon]RLF70915.1 MAG: hypothetical protein DRN40_03555 [Thermoplasmata archaeon]RLF71402.1 MAG: hypothetical protein DRN35_02505 [Thermoplasmata archaeon]
MNSADYLRGLRLHLLPLPRKVREEVLREVSSHLNEARTRGGESLVSETLERFGPPSKLALNYIRIWGVSTTFLLSVGALGFILGLLSAPLKLSFFGLVPPPPAPSLLYLLLLLLLVSISYRYGLKTGLVMGLLGGAGYISNVLLTYDLYKDWTTFTYSDIYSLTFNTVLLPAAGAVLGYLGERFWEIDIEMEGQV